MMNRRSLLFGMAAAIAAPAVIRSGILMPVKSFEAPLPVLIGRGSGVEIFTANGGFRVPSGISNVLIEMIGGGGGAGGGGQFSRTQMIIGGPFTVKMLPDA